MTEKKAETAVAKEEETSVAVEVEEGRALERERRGPQARRVLGHRLVRGRSQSRLSQRRKIRPARPDSFSFYSIHSVFSQNVEIIKFDHIKTRLNIRHVDRH